MSINNSTEKKSNKIKNLLKKNYSVLKEKIFRSKISIIILSFLLGIIFTLTFQFLKHYYEFSIIKKHLNNPYYLNQHYFNLIDIDEIDSEFAKIQEQFNRSLDFHNNFHQEFKENFDKRLKENQEISNVYTSDLTVDQDEKNVFYKLKFSGYNKDEIIVEIKDKILKFYAQKDSNQETKKALDHQANKQNSSQSDQKSFSSFNYSLLISNQVDLEKPHEINRLDQEIIVKFSKKSK